MDIQTEVAAQTKSHLNEESIRPGALFSSYLDLCIEDCSELFDKSRFVAVVCPCCGADFAAQAPLFVKYGFTYSHCQSCQSISVNPRPTAGQVQNFYREGKSVRYWSSQFYKDTVEQRRVLLARPKAERLALAIKKYLGTDRVSVFDVGAGYGVFLEEISQALPHAACVAIEPGPDFVRLFREKRQEVIPKFIEELEQADISAALRHDDRARVFVSHELIEHILEPEQFLQAMKKVMRPGDLFHFTTLSASGFDILYLLSESNSLHPPHHITFFSIAALEQALQRAGFAILSLETPGELDVQIVRRSKKIAGDLSLKVLTDTPDKAWAFQEHLKANRMSSHVSVICRLI